MSNIKDSYCIKEKKITKSIDPIIMYTKNGNKYIKSTCVICGNKKSTFIKKNNYFPKK